MTTTAATPITYGDAAALAKFSVARYHRMIETGILTPEDKVELLENYVVLKMARNPPHDSTIQRLLRSVLPLLPSGWDCRIQSAITLSDSEPEPDFVVARGSADDFDGRHPGPDDIGLVAEVADSSLPRDQRDKTRIYARAGIACYWIINLVDRRVEVYTQPSGPTPVPAYGTFQVFQPGDDLPFVLDGGLAGTIPVVRLFPPRP